MIALCLGAAAALALSVLRPGPEPGREVVVVARTIGAGSVITADDLTTRALPPDALPARDVFGRDLHPRDYRRYLGQTRSACPSGDWG